jgi:hypothetical protein
MSSKDARWRAIWWYRGRNGSPGRVAYRVDLGMLLASRVHPNTQHCPRFRGADNRCRLACPSLERPNSVVLHASEIAPHTVPTRRRVNHAPTSGRFAEVGAGVAVATAPTPPVTGPLSEL